MKPNTPLVVEAAYRQLRETMERQGWRVGDPNKIRVNVADALQALGDAGFEVYIPFGD